MDDAFADACHEVTGGNPFLAGELLAELEREAVVPSADSVPIVRSVGPKGVARSVLIRIAALGSQAVQLARAVAVLGEDVAIRHAAAVAGLEPGETEATAGALARSAVLAERTPLAFAHPILRAAVEADMPAAARALLHAHAATALRADRVEPERIGAHVLATEPGLMAGARAVLLEAAESALERGVPAEAVRYLARFSEEPGPDEPAIRRLIGIASLRAGDAAGIDDFEAVMSVGDPDDRAEAARALAVAFVARSRGNGAAGERSGWPCARRAS